MFLLSSDRDILGKQRFNQISVNYFLHIGSRGSKFYQGGLRVYDYAHFTVSEVTADISRVDFHEGGLSMVEIDFCLALDEEFSFLALGDPLAVDLAGCNADVDQIG